MWLVLFVVRWCKGELCRAGRLLAAGAGGGGLDGELVGEGACHCCDGVGSLSS